jgi:hypothetical protein
VIQAVSDAESGAWNRDRPLLECERRGGTSTRRAARLIHERALGEPNADDGREIRGADNDDDGLHEMTSPLAAARAGPRVSVLEALPHELVAGNDFAGWMVLAHVRHVTLVIRCPDDCPYHSRRAL